MPVERIDIKLSVARCTEERTDIQIVGAAVGDNAAALADAAESSAERMFSFDEKKTATSSSRRDGGSLFLRTPGKPISRT